MTLRRSMDTGCLWTAMMPRVAPLLGCRERGVDHGGRSGGVEVDVGACLPGVQRVSLAMQRDEAADDVFVGGVDHCVGTDLEGLVQACWNQIGHRHVSHAERFEGQHRANADGPRAEHHDLVGRFGLAAIDAVTGDRHRFVEGGHLERDVVGDDLPAGSCPSGVCPCRGGRPPIVM